MELESNNKYALDGYAVYCWGAQLTFDAANMILVDQALVAQYPAIIA